MCSAPELLAKSTNEAPFLVVYNDRFAAHAGLVHGVPHVNMPLLVLAESVSISPHQPLRRHQPVVDALVGMRTGTNHGKASAGFVRSLNVKRRQGRGQACSGTCGQERSASMFVHGGR